MPKIALIKPKTIEQYDDYSKIVDSISDWQEVTTEERNLLRTFCEKYDYSIIEFVENQEGIISKGVQYALNEAKKWEEQKVKEEAERERRKQERLLKKKAKDEKAELELLKQLEAKYKKESN